MDKKAFSKNTQTAETSQHFLDYWRVVRMRYPMVLTIFFLVVGAAVALTFLMPEKFESTVRIRVTKDSDVAGLYDVSRSTTYDPYFVLTEFEVIKSKSVLYKVIEELQLVDRWSKSEKIPGLTLQQTYYMLLKSMDVRQFRNTELIEISVRNKVKLDAATIANKIAEVYRDERIKNYEQRTTKNIDTFNATLTTVDNKIQQLQQKVDGLRKDLEISDYLAEGSSMAPTLEPEAVRKLDMERINSETLYAQAESFLEAITNKVNLEERLSAVMAVNPNDMVLSELIVKYNTAKQELASRSVYLQPENEELKKVISTVEEVENQIEKRVNDIIVGLQVKASSLRDQADTIQKRLDDAKKLDRDNSAKYRPYWDAKRELESEVRMRELLKSRLYVEDINKDIPRTSIVQVTDQAEPGIVPVEPNKSVNIILGIIVGLVSGIGFAFFMEYLDTSAKTIDEVEQAMGTAVVGVIPQNVAYLKDDPNAVYAEAYRVLRTNLLFSRKDEHWNTISVISGGAAEGKSTTIFNLATVFAQNGNRVLLVDTDLRRPSLHKVLNVSNSIGLTNFLMRQKTLEDVIQVTPVKGLDFLPSGKLPSTAMGILNSSRMKEFYNEVRSRYDYVFFDSPPIMGVSDASVLASLVDMVLMVVQYRKYPLAMTIRAKQAIEKVGGNLMGIVLNNISIAQDSYYYYYSGYYYDYYSKNSNSEDADSEGSRRSRRHRSSSTSSTAMSAIVSTSGTNVDSEKVVASVKNEVSENDTGLKKY